MFFILSFKSKFKKILLSIFNILVHKCLIKRIIVPTVHTKYDFLTVNLNYFVLLILIFLFQEKKKEEFIYNFFFISHPVKKYFYFKIQLIIHFIFSEITKNFQIFYDRNKIFNKNEKSDRNEKICLSVKKFFYIKLIYFQNIIMQSFKKNFKQKDHIFYRSKNLLLIKICCQL